MGCVDGVGSDCVVCSDGLTIARGGVAMTATRGVARGMGVGFFSSTSSVCGADAASEASVASCGCIGADWSLFSICGMSTTDGAAAATVTALVELVALDGARAVGVPTAGASEGVILVMVIRSG